MKTNQVLASIMAMNVSEIDSVIEAVNFRQKQLRSESKSQFSPGQRVEFSNSRTMTNMKGVIEKINRKYIVVNTDNSGRWNVSPVSLRAC